MTATTSVPTESVDPRSIFIDLEFQKRIPPISAEEKRLLAESLDREGCRDPLVCAKLQDGEGDVLVLLDGHNRKAICEELDLQVRIVTLEGIETRDDALAWIDENQLGRRNLSDNALRMIRGRLYNRAKGAAGDGKASTKSGGQGDHQKTAERIGDQLGVSEKTIRRDGSLAEAVEKLTEKLPGSEAGILSTKGPKPVVIREAARVVDEHPNLAERLLEGTLTVSESRKEVGEATTAPEQVVGSSGVFDVIVVDPLWREKKRGRPKKPSPGEVAPMGEADLSALKLPAADDCHVFLWTPHDRLPEAMRVLASWKLECRCAFTWVKPEADVAGQPALNSELILYARRGEPAFLSGAKVETAFTAENCHGRQKPDEFYAMLVGATEGQRLLMFAELEAEGFDCWSGEDETDGSGDDASEIPPDDPGDGSSDQDGRTGEGTLFDDDVPEEPLVAGHGE